MKTSPSNPPHQPFRGMPGVLYPDQIEETQMSQAPLEIIPDGYMTTKQAAELMDMPYSSAHRHLHASTHPSLNYRSPEGNETAIWKREHILDTISKLPPIATESNLQGLLTLAEAASRVGFALRTIQRRVSNRVVPIVQRRVPSHRGHRLRDYIREADLSLLSRP